MKSVVTIEERRTSTDWRFIVKDLDCIIEILIDVDRKRGKRKALECARQYRELILSPTEQAEQLPVFVCNNCGRPTSVEYTLSFVVGHKLCEVCAKAMQSQTQTSDDEILFDELINESEME